MPIRERLKRPTPLIFSGERGLHTNKEGVRGPFAMQASLPTGELERLADR